MSTEQKQFQAFQWLAEALTTMIQQTVANEFQIANSAIQLNPKPETDGLLSRAETGKLLGVSYTTLFHWNNNKTLPAQKIGGRVYYQKSVIMNKLNRVA